MNDADARLLFVPVSGPRGMGEYARSLAIATAVAHRWPRAQIHFAVSGAASYAASLPFAATRLPSSPTFHSREMAELIGSFRPTLVVFDNAGRTLQLRAAAGSGARIVYVSSRPRQRRKAFRLRWMRVIDEHWIAYPAFIAGELAPIERLKLRLLGRPVVRFLDAVLPESDAGLGLSLMQRFTVEPGEYVLVLPGGGSAHPGARAAPAVIAEAARRLAARGYPTILVGVAAQAPAPGANPQALRLAPILPMAMIGELIRGARLVLVNGGDSLLQALACGRPCVAAPIARDQPRRIRECARAGLVLPAQLDSAELERVALLLLTDDALRSALTLRVASSGIANGMGTAVAAIERMVNGALG